MAHERRPLRVIELITLLVIAGLVVAVALPRCGAQNDPAPATHNQPLPAKTTSAKEPAP